MPSKPRLWYNLSVILVFLTLQLALTETKSLVTPSSLQHSSEREFNSTSGNNSHSHYFVEYPSLSFIKRPPKFLLAHTHATAIFECIPKVVNGTDDVSITWLLPQTVPILSKNNIHSNQHSGAYITPNNSILILHNLEEIFSGIYQCIAQTRNGTRSVAEMTLKVTFYMAEMRRWLIISLCGGGTCFVIIVITILSCKIQRERKKFYRERKRVKMQQVLYSHR